MSQTSFIAIEIPRRAEREDNWRGNNYLEREPCFDANRKQRSYGKSECEQHTKEVPFDPTQALGRSRQHQAEITDEKRQKYARV